MRALTPWGGVGTFRHEMERVFDRFVEPRWEEFEAGGDWQPRVDLAETKDAVVVKAEIPGVDQKDIQVTLQGELLTIKGQKQQQREEKDEHYHRVERSYGAFARSFRLPGAVDGAKVTAAFKDGVLTVTLPKAASAKGTAIPIKTA